MLTLVIRCFLIYVIVLFICRFMGKRQMGELQPFEFVITLIIADLATIPMAEINVPLVHGVIPLFTLAILHYLISLLCRKSLWARTVVNGKPIIVISPRGLDYNSLKTLNMNVDDLIESLRENNYFSFEDVLYAIVETNGKLTVLPKIEKSPLTVGDANLNLSENKLPIVLVQDGKFMKENLILARIDESFVLKQIEKVGTNKIKDILVATLDQEGKMYIQQKNKQFKITQTSKLFKEMW